jgi:2,5-furandicarboxylate decarboxylase 1
MNPVVDLNEYLERLSEEDMLIRIQEEVDIKHKLASLAVESEKKGEGALLFESIKGHRIPVVTNLYSVIERVCLAFGAEKERLHDFFLTAMNRRVKPSIVNVGKVEDSEEDTLDDLPIPYHSLYDGGRYITGVLTAKEGDVRALQFARFQVKGPKRLGVRIDPGRRIREIMKGKGALDVAVIIGAPPSVEFAAAIKGLGYDKLELAGALQGKPIEVIKCKEVECEIPANAQIMIEGVMNLKNLEVEGPFAEFTGYYGPPEPMPVIDVKRICRRTDAVFRTIIGGSMEHLMLNNLAREAVIYDSLRRSVPGIIDVHLPPYACGFIAFLSIKNEYVREAKNALLAALSAHPVVKYAIIVDEDVNIWDEREVLWALATRSGGDEDIIVIPKAFNHVMDPASEEGMVNKVGIDATFPPEKRKLYKKVKYLD